MVLDYEALVDIIDTLIEFTLNYEALVDNSNWIMRLLVHIDTLIWYHQCCLLWGFSWKSSLLEIIRWVVKWIILHVCLTFFFWLILFCFMMVNFLSWNGSMCLSYLREWTLAWSNSSSYEFNSQILDNN